MTYTEKVIAGLAPPVTHLQKVIAGEARPVTHLEYVWAGGSPPSVQEYTGAVPVIFIADGTPTPDNPIMPQGTGEKTGNLWSFHPNTTSVGVTLTWDGEKIVFSGTCSSALNVVSSTFTLPKGTYTLKANANRIPVDRATVCIDLYRASPFFQKKIENNVSVDGSVTFTIEEDTVLTMRIRLETGVNYDGFALKPMLNSGESSLPYEPYGYKLDISSADTTTPVYLGEVETTRKVEKYECTGDENWRFYSDSTGEYGAWQFYVDNVVNGLPFSSALSNIADYGVTAATRSRYPYGVHLVTSGTGIAFQMAGAKDIFPDVAAWKSYLQQQYTAGTPVTVWYVLANETTAVVNEPLMKIGDYADTLSMEQAGAQIPTANGSTTLDVETTVKPSEVYIKYRGEAVATLSMLSAEVSSPEAVTEEVNPEETEETENGSEDVSL